MNYLKSLNEDAITMFKSLCLTDKVTALQALDTLQGNQDAINFVDTFIIRINAARSVSTASMFSPKLSLKIARETLGQLCLETFSKPMDISDRLTSAGFKTTDVESYLSRVIQPATHYSNDQAGDSSAQSCGDDSNRHHHSSISLANITHPQYSHPNHHHHHHGSFSLADITHPNHHNHCRN